MLKCAEAPRSNSARDLELFHFLNVAVGSVDHLPIPEDFTAPENDWVCKTDPEDTFGDRAHKREGSAGFPNDSMGFDQGYSVLEVVISRSSTDIGSLE